MKKEFIIVAAIIICIAGLFIVLNNVSSAEETFTDDFNYNTTFMNLKNHPVVLINNTTGEETLMSHSDYVGMFP